MVSPTHNGILCPAIINCSFKLPSHTTFAPFLIKDIDAVKILSLILVEWFAAGVNLQKELLEEISFVVIYCRNLFSWRSALYLRIHGWRLIRLTQQEVDKLFQPWMHVNGK